MTRTAGCAIRGFETGDEERVLALLTKAMGPGPTGERSSGFFRWKHLQNPFGRSLLLVAEADGEIVGLRAFMRWRFRTPGGTLRAVTAVDTATHPDHRGRGIFSDLTRAALDSLSGSADLIFNTPNDKSGPGYLKMGWQEVGDLPVWIRPLRPLRLLRDASSMRAAAVSAETPPGPRTVTMREALADGDALNDLLSRVETVPNTIATDRDVAYLRWRYDNPHLAYRAVVEKSDGVIDGIGIFRLRQRGRLRELTMSELIVGLDDPSSARRLLSRAARAAKADYACVRPTTSPLRTLVVQAPRRIRLMVRPIAAGLDPDPTKVASWTFSLGDLEVF